MAKKTKGDATETVETGGTFDPIPEELLSKLEYLQKENEALKLKLADVTMQRGTVDIKKDFENALRQKLKEDPAKCAAVFSNIMNRVDQFRGNKPSWIAAVQNIALNDIGGLL
jgi:hypothetical protein